MLLFIGIIQLINTNDTYNVTNINKLVNLHDNSYFLQRKQNLKIIPLTLPPDITITIMNIM